MIDIAQSVSNAFKIGCFDEPTIKQEPSDNLDDPQHTQATTGAFGEPSSSERYATAEAQIKAERDASPLMREGEEVTEPDYTPVMILLAIAALFLFYIVLKWVVERIMIVGLAFVLARILWEIVAWVREDVLSGKRGLKGD